jgi:triphosphoribosyl-dephospho-CoA synthase
MSDRSRNPRKEILALAPNVSRETSTVPHALALEECVRRACVLEATARKPGNVHPESDPAAYDDLLRSANAIAPVIAQAETQGLGATVLEAIRATRRVVDHNTNLGIVLLLAPMAAVPRDVPLEEGIDEVLARTTRRDARDVYEAIRLAEPGGLGRVPRQDVSKRPTCTLVGAMRLAADRDLVAAQYCDGFSEVLDEGVLALQAAILAAQLRAGGDPHSSLTAPGKQQGRPALPTPPAQVAANASLETFAGGPLDEGIIHFYLYLLSRYLDSLIFRKCGIRAAKQVARRASAVLAAGGPATDLGTQRLAEFDAWLRADGNRRNPGTTADLVAACLFALLRDVGANH